ALHLLEILLENRLGGLPAFICRIKHGIHLLPSVKGQGFEPAAFARDGAAACGAKDRDFRRAGDIRRLANAGAVGGKCRLIRIRKASGPRSGWSA
ncbi:MAG TPA: hypothetical protein VN680_07070, partial [Burkholderiaceae bacterium]|nr:hypothetical protein [Burkholderiaceae bacterium]